MSVLVVPWTVAEVRGVSPRNATETAGDATEPAETVEFPAFLQGNMERATPRVLTNKGVARRTAVIQRVAALREPRTGSPKVATLSTRTAEGTDAVVLALEEREDESGLPWVRVRLPVLPHDATGWVPRQALGPYKTIRTRLVLDRTRLRANLVRRGKIVFRAPIGIGKVKWPTPRGNFFVRNKLTNFDNPFYGPVAFGTSARSSVLTDWPGGGFVGIHGTNRPNLLPGRVSHGCVRLRNRDIVRLAQLMPVGTPIQIL